MSAICLIVSGVIRATLPGPDFTLSWDHSVEKTRWEERYRVTGGQLTLIAASVQGIGAGMEPPPGATLRDGTWAWSPRTTHTGLRLTRSTFTSDYTLCADGRCKALGEWTGAAAEGDVVTVRACGAEPQESTSGKPVGR